VPGGAHVADGDAVPDDSITFSFESSSPNGATETFTYLCSLDGGADESCDSGTTFSGLANGHHTLDVHDTTGPESASFQWTVNKPAATTTTTGTTTAQQQAKDASFAGVAASFGSSINVVGGRAKFRLRSPENSTGTLSGKSSQPVAASVAAKKKKRISIGKVNFTLTAGVPKTVSLKLSKVARRVLAKKGKLKVRITITARDAAGNPKVSGKTVTLKVKRKKRKR
jgi:hypothetical protein